mmetsp:Transcript_36699/g.63335  ORF Transcript_36699/g.63335 Transcript_36699/m.63335 type:complete len:397 (-) Transcript_36699:5-1195(-)
MQHDHLKFYSHGSSGANNPIGSFQLGGTGVVPILINGQSSSSIKTADAQKTRSTVEKHIEIVEYLKKLPDSSWATFVDIQRELNINLQEDIYVLGMLKSNPRVEQQQYGSNAGEKSLAFQYRARYNISNKSQLIETIRRSKNGVVLEDIKNCYEGIEADCGSMIVGGDIIAVKNKVEFKSLVLYPRGRPFLTKLSGTVTATPGQQLVKTSTDFRTEIRRGEAIQVGEYWYRVGSAIGSGAAGEQIQRAAAPTSVTIDKDMSGRNVYCDPFTNEVLPLDGDFEGNEVYTGPCFRHGCSSDIKQCWEHTAEGLRGFLGDGDALHRELINLNLVSKHASSAAPLKAKREVKAKAKRKITRTRVNANTSSYGTNAHLKGTGLEKVILEARAKAEREEQLR